MPKSTKRGGARPGAGRPRLAEGRTRRIEITLGEDEIEILERVPASTESPQAAIRYLIAQERSRSPTQ